MHTEIYPIPDCPVGRLAIMPRPRSGDWLEDEIQSWYRQGLGRVVSLLEDVEIEELGLEAEQECCERIGLTFLRLPIPDRGVPQSYRSVTELASLLIPDLQSGVGVGIHCRMGIGRSSTIAVCVLAKLGVPIDTGWQWVQQSRKALVPDTVEQKEWVARWQAQQSSL